jgi:hypothetical protein
MRALRSAGGHTGEKDRFYMISNEYVIPPIATAGHLQRAKTPAPQR